MKVRRWYQNGGDASMAAETSERCMLGLIPICQQITFWHLFWMLIFRLWKRDDKCLMRARNCFGVSVIWCKRTAPSFVWTAAVFRRVVFVLFSRTGFLDRPVVTVYQRSRFINHCILLPCRPSIVRQNTFGINSVSETKRTRCWIVVSVLACLFGQPSV